MIVRVGMVAAVALTVESNALLGMVVAGVPAEIVERDQI